MLVFCNVIDIKSKANHDLFEYCSTARYTSDLTRCAVNDGSNSIKK